MFKQSLKINFWISVAFSVVAGIGTLWMPEWLTVDTESLYGPLRNNLDWVMIYLVLAESLLAYYAYSRGIQAAALYMGVVFLSVAGGLPFYGSLNAIPINEYSIIACVYVGLSHLAHFFAQQLPAPVENPRL